MRKCGNAFSHVIQKYAKFANFTLLYFRDFTILYNQTLQFPQIQEALSNCAKLFSNLKVCLIGEWSIEKNCASNIGSWLHRIP